MGFIDSKNLNCPCLLRTICGLHLHSLFGNNPERVVEIQTRPQVASVASDFLTKVSKISQTAFFYRWNLGITPNGVNETWNFFLPVLAGDDARLLESPVNWAGARPGFAVTLIDELRLLKHLAWFGRTRCGLTPYLSSIFLITEATGNASLGDGQTTDFRLGLVEFKVLASSKHVI